MATATLTGTLLDAAKVPIPSAPVSVKLVAGARGGHASAGEIVTHVRTVTALDGTFSAVVERNSDITPAGSYYTVLAPGAVWNVRLTGAGPYTVGDSAIAVTPAPVVASGATTGYVDAAIAANPGGLTTEQVQDAVGAMATDTATIDFTYDDTAATLVADVKTASITNAMLAGSIALSKITGLGTAAPLDSGTGAGNLPTKAQADTLYQPLDSDLTAIAALTTTTFGRAFLALADAAAARTALALGTAATSASAAFDAAGAAAAAQAASQPLDSDLTAIAALTTTTFGRALLALADAAAGRTALGLGTAATSATSAFDAAGAATAAQAAAVQRANHTGTQAVATITGLATVATSGSASDLGTGTLPAARLPAATASAQGALTASDFLKIAGVRPDLYNVSTTSLARWRTALTGARAASRGPAKILWIGDSYAEGFSIDIPTGQSEADVRAANRLLTMLNGTLVPDGKAFDGIFGFNTGVGAQAYDLRWTPGATNGTVPYPLSWGGTGAIDLNVSVGVPTSRATWAGLTCNGFKIYSAQSVLEANPSFKWDIDGGATTNVNSSAAGTVDGILTTTAAAGSYASHTLGLTSIASSSGYIMAIEAYRAAANGLISVGSAGVGATGTTQWIDNSFPAAAPLTAIAAVQPDLVIIQLGGNDINGGMTAATFLTNMNTIAAACQAAGADVITIGPPPIPPSFANPTLRTAYRDSYRSNATTYGAVHIDLAYRWGETFESASQRGFISTDDIHGSKAGYADIAQAVADVLVMVGG
jgi:lysophospholipase L1-like esterase